MNSDSHPKPDSTPLPCDVHPTFSCNVPEHTQEVTLQRENYVKLLVDARVTDPACWPPGMEAVAGMIERVRDIEEECMEKHGEFDPEKLSTEVQDEYMDLHLVLDTIQENGDMQEVADLIAATTVSANHAATTPVEIESTPSTQEIWPAFPTLQEKDNFA